MTDDRFEAYPEDRPRTATIRSRVVLEVASELVGSGEWEPKQSIVRMRQQGDSEWSFTFFGSDSASVIEEVGNGAVHVAIVNPATVAGPATLGIEPFSGPIPVRAIATIPSDDRLGFVVHERTGIEDLADIATHPEPLRVSLRGGRPDHSVHIVLDHLLRALGTSLQHWAECGHLIQHDRGLPHRSVRSALLREGETDVLIDEGIYNWVDLALDARYRFLSIPDDALNRLEDLGYRRARIEQDRYPRLAADVETLDFSGFLVYTHVDTPDHVVAAFCRALVARRDRIPWQGGPTLPLERMVTDVPDAPIPVPFHPAAERVWRDEGLLGTVGG